MRVVHLKLTILGAVSIFSSPAISAGFVNIPTTGFSGSAYTRCMAQPITIGGNSTSVGNFGSGNAANGNPTPTPNTAANNICAIVPPPVNDLVSPEANYTLVTTATRNILINNLYTSGSNINVGNVLEVVWRKPAASTPVTTAPMCIIGTRVALTNVIYSTAYFPGSRFSLTDIARGGWNGVRIDAAYALTNSAASPVHRIGRSYTSVQHRALATLANGYGNNGDALPGTNYLDLPGTGATTVSINGVNPVSGTVLVLYLPNPTMSQQDAGVDDGWIDFTLDAVAVDKDGSTNQLSAMTYIKFACNNDSAAKINSTATGGWTRSDVIRLRQTGQESDPFISVSTSGYVLPSQPTVLPVSTAPF